MRHSLLVVLAASFISTAAISQPINLKVLGQPVGSGLIQKNKEQPFFEKLAQTTGLNISVQYSPVDVAGVPDTVNASGEFCEFICKWNMPYITLVEGTPNVVTFAGGHQYLNPTGV